LKFQSPEIQEYFLNKFKISFLFALMVLGLPMISACAQGPSVTTVTSTKTVVSTLSIDFPEQGHIELDTGRFEYKKLVLNDLPITFKGITIISKLPATPIVTLPDLSFTIGFPDAAKEEITIPKALDFQNQIYIWRSAHENPAAGIVLLERKVEPSPASGDGGLTYEYYLLVSD
jgi:hypothetical protein